MFFNYQLRLDSRNLIVCYLLSCYATEKVAADVISNSQLFCVIFTDNCGIKTVQPFIIIIHYLPYVRVLNLRKEKK